MLLDHYLPHCDFSERHTILTRATPEHAYAALHVADFSRSRIIRLLLRLRGMRNPSFRATGAFTLLEENPPSELVIGLQGPFWKPACKLDDVDASTFLRTSVPDGVARGAWNFSIEREDGGTRITTETRVLCGRGARTPFAVYWFFIRPWSGLIRRVMLRRIRAEAERVRD